MTTRQIIVQHIGKCHYSQWVLEDDTLQAELEGYREYTKKPAIV